MIWVSATFPILHAHMEAFAFFQFQALECLPKLKIQLLFLFNFSDALSTTEQGQIVSASSSSLRSQNYLDNVIQWNVVVKRYRDLKSESPGKDNDDY